MRHRMGSLGLVAAVAGVSVLAVGDASARPYKTYGMALTPEAKAERDAARAAQIGFEASAPPGDTSTAAQGGVVTYCGGPVLSNVEIVPVFWGSAGWTGTAATVKTWSVPYLTSLVNSAFMDNLNQYSTAGKTGVACGQADDGGISYAGPDHPFSTGQTIGRGTITQAYTITPINKSTTLNDDNGDVGKEITAQIAAGGLPKPTYDAQGYPNTFYFAFFPTNYKISLQGGASCQVFAGYHGSTPYAGGSCAGQYVSYAVIPICSSGSDTTSMATTCSHELAEAVTDTDDMGGVGNNGDLGWYLGPTNTQGQSCTNCGEVGDVCDQAQCSDGSSNPETVSGTSIVAECIYSANVNKSSAIGCATSDKTVSAQMPPSGPANSCATTPPTVDAGPPVTVDAGPPVTADAGPPPAVDAGGHHFDGGPPPGVDASIPPVGGHDGGTPPSSQDGGNTGPGAPDASLSDGGTNGSGGGGGGGGGGSNSGSGCSTAPVGTSSNGLGIAGALLGLALMGAKRRNKR